MPVPLPLPLLLLLLLQPALARPLVLQPPPADRADKLKFGHSALLSRSGSRLLVGANGFRSFRGAVYAYDMVTPPGDKPQHWRRALLSANHSQPAVQKAPRELRPVSRGSGLGFSMAATADARAVVIGAPGHDMQKGAVFVFADDGPAEAQWRQVGMLGNSFRRGGDVFGWALDVDEAGETVLVSAKGRRANNGEVYSYRCGVGCTACEIVQRIAPPDVTDATGPRGIRIRNNFGVSLVVNAKGDVMAVGSTGFQEERGAVYVYSREDVGGNWTLAQRLESPNAEKFGFFGFKLAMDAEGTKLLIGADGERDYRGAAYLFSRKTGKDGQVRFEHLQQLTAGKRHVEDNFGGSVALSADGKAIVVGAPGVNKGNGKDHGVMYMFEEVKGRRNSKWALADSVWLPQEHSQSGNFFAWTVGLSGDGKRFVSTAPDSYSGAGLVTVGELQVTGKRAMDAKDRLTDEVIDDGKQEL